MADYVSKHTGKQIDEAVEAASGIKKVYNLYAYIGGDISSTSTSDVILAPLGGAEGMASIAQEVLDGKATFCLDSKPLANVDRRMSSHDFAQISNGGNLMILRVTFDSVYPSFSEGVILHIELYNGVASFKEIRYNKICSLNDPDRGFYGGVCDNLNEDYKNTGVVSPRLKTVLSAHQGVIVDSRLKALESGLLRVAEFQSFGQQTTTRTDREIYELFGGQDKYEAFVKAVVMDRATPIMRNNSFVSIPENFSSYGSNTADYAINIVVGRVVFKFTRTDGLVKYESIFERNIPAMPPEDGKTYGIRNGSWVEIPTTV